MHANSRPPLHFNHIFDLNFIVKQVYIQLFTSMKAILLAVLLVLALATTHAAHQMKIQVGERKQLANGSSAYKVDCVGTTQQVSYNVDGLPEGASFQNNHLIFPSNIAPGTYTITITASDASNDSTSQVIQLSIVEDHSNMSSNTGGPFSSSGSAQGQSGSSSKVDSRLSQILNTYSTVTQYKINYEGNTYPTTNFPTGGTGDNINTDVIYINRVAQATPQNRNTITSDYVALIAASERYQTAVKSVTNLLTIIDQARANKAQAQADLITYTNRYQTALKRQRQSQEVIISIEIKITQIRSAINSAQGRMGAINIQITDIQNMIRDLEARNNNLDDLIDQEEAKRVALIAELNDINAEIRAILEERRVLEDNCAKIKMNLDQANADIKEKRTALSTLQARIAQAEIDLRSKTAEVERLAALLESAKNAQAEASMKLTDLRSQARLLPGQINALTIRINTLTIQYEECQKKVDEITRRIDALRTTEITRIETAIGAIEARLREYQKERGDNKARLGQYRANLQSLVTQVGDLESTLNYLKSELTRYQEEIRSAYNAGNDANNLVIVAKQNLAAVNQRWEQQCEIEDQATLNLEKARAEQQLARLALEEIIASYSNALPYAIVPNANGVNAGNPIGNNPAGSPLGQATGSSSRIQIDNWTNYLSSAFGRGINPALDENINYLYPFTMNTESGLRRNDENICDANGPVRAIEGTITGTENGAINLNAYGQNYQVNYAGCTRFSANKPNYQPKAGDKLIARGTTVGSQMQCQQAVAISH